MNNGLNVSIFVLMLTVFCVSGALGATYFVDQAHPNASDENSGTKDLPWKTIQKAAQTLVAGDTALIKGGTYREKIAPKNNGVEGSPVTYKVFPGHKVVIKGSEIVADWKHHQGAVYRKGQWSKSARVGASFIFWKDAPLEGAKALTQAYKYETLRPGTYFYDKQTDCVYIWLHDNSDPNKHTIEAPVRRLVWEIKDKSWLVVSGFEMRHGNSGISMSGHHNLVRDCTVSWNPYGGISVSGKYNTLKNCVSAYCGFQGIGGSGKNHLIDGNISMHNNLMRYYPAGSGGGGKFMALMDSTIRNHTARNNFGPGLWFDCCGSGNIIENSRFHTNEGPGIFLEVTPGTIVRNCRLYNNMARSAGYLLLVDAVHHKQPVVPFFHYGSSIQGNGIHLSYGVGSKIYNCVFFNNRSYGVIVQGQWDSYRERWIKAGFTTYHGLDKSKFTLKTEIVNNIFLDNHKGQLKIDNKYSSGENKEQIEIDFNLVWDYAGGRAPILSYDGKDFYSVSEITKHAGLGKRWVNKDPEFIRPGGGDFRVSALSPALDAGKSLALAPLDCDGKKRPVGSAFDLGPFEDTVRGMVFLKKADRAAKPKEPKNLKYFIVDLEPFINRSFEDKQKNDGKDGWNDEGPGRDLREFPRGKQTFKGVPFIISPKGCVTLSSDIRKSAGLPKKVIIPVGKKAGVFYFLHTAVFEVDGNIKRIGAYVIRFADGRKKEIDLTYPYRMWDWEGNIGPCAKFEPDTTTTTIWHKYTPKPGSPIRHRKVQRMMWVNPHPDAAIESIGFTGTGKGVLALISITGGAKKN